MPHNVCYYKHFSQFSFNKEKNSEDREQKVQERKSDRGNRNVEWSKQKHATTYLFSCITFRARLVLTRAIFHYILGKYHFNMVLFSLSAPSPSAPQCKIWKHVSERFDVSDCGNVGMIYWSYRSYIEIPNMPDDANNKLLQNIFRYFFIWRFILYTSINVVIFFLFWFCFSCQFPMKKIDGKSKTFFFLLRWHQP